MAATHTLPLASPGMARICLYGDLQRFGRRIDLRVKTGAEAIRALATQIPAFRRSACRGQLVKPLLLECIYTLQTPLIL